MSRAPGVPELQKRSWGFYGFPGSDNKAVGEVRYVVGWHADQMTRLEWDVFIGGSEAWFVDIPNPSDAPKDQPKRRIATRGDDGEEDQTAASAQLLDFIDWNDTNVRAVDTNLFVGGQGDYIRTPDRWSVVSMVQQKRREALRDALDVVPFLWPHPADPTKPDAPLFSVLELLDELDWLSRQARTQSRQRSLISGIVGTATGLIGPPTLNGEPTGFWDQWNDAMSARMVDTDDLSPIRLQGEIDMVRDGINWVVPDFGYDAVLDRKMASAIQRLAYGLPIPPEILLGMQAQSRATAFQVEENAYRAHIEPPAWMVAQVAQDALRLILDRDDVEVVPNPSKMLARKQSVQDVKDAYDRGLVTPEYVREVLGIPEDAAPDPEVDGTPPGTPQDAPTDPANVAADEPVAAATRTPDLSDLLADIDAHLSSELAGVTVMATDRARQRLGAAARSGNPQYRNGEFKGLTSSQLACHLGWDQLTASGVDVAAQIAEPIDTAARWWTRRVTEAWAQAAALVPGWSGQGAWIEESVDRLANGLTTHIVETLSLSESPPMDAEGIREVVDAAAGGGM